MTVNPAMTLAAPAPKNACERMLDDKELKALWAALKNPVSVKGHGGKSVT